MDKRCWLDNQLVLSVHIYILYIMKVKRNGENLDLGEQISQKTKSGAFGQTY